MEKKHRISSATFILIAVCILGSVAASISLQHILPHLNRWQKGGYAIVGGIFIAMTAVIVNEILAFFQNE
jgi:uncharacterized membrane protein